MNTCLPLGSRTHHFNSWSSKLTRHTLIHSNTSLIRFHVLLDFQFETGFSKTVAELR